MIKVNPKQMRAFLGERGLGSEGKTVEHQLATDSLVTPETLKARADNLVQLAKEATNEARREAWRDRIEFGGSGSSDLTRTTDLKESARELRFVADYLGREEVQASLEEFLANTAPGAAAHLGLIV
ncbi:MAG: hypothetical protein IT384_04070 [Deltaproteobacteria bacterium]|nr:hypothetical protein [Deltaproteobacteria bacterium]